MALTTCTDCGRQVSDKAAACPHCGCPIGSGQPTSGHVASDAPVHRPPVQTIERTGKGWKAVQLLGGVIALLGFAACCAVFSPNATNVEKQQLADSGVWMSFAGFVVWVIGRIGGWWNHG